VNFRRSDATWISRRAWTDRANSDEWLDFVTRATPRQLHAFGFPPPGHPYWTHTTLQDLERRYPGIDSRPWA
jgi:hypothetical protein